MKSLNHRTIISMFFLLLGSWVTAVSALNNAEDSGLIKSSLECPADVPLARKGIEKFLLSNNGPTPLLKVKEKFSHRDQIKLLEDSEDTRACRFLNEEFSKTLAIKEHSDQRNEEYYGYDVIYYKGQGFYFAITIKKFNPEGDKEKHVSHSECLLVGLYVYDGDLNGLFLTSLGGGLDC